MIKVFIVNGHILNAYIEHDANTTQTKDTFAAPIYQYEMLMNLHALHFVRKVGTSIYLVGITIDSIYIRSRCHKFSAWYTKNYIYYAD